jgi:hypothetical protein
MYAYEILIPLGVCVILPVMIVWLVSRVRQKEIDRKAEIMLKAIEAGVEIDPELFGENKKTEVPRAKIKSKLLDKLSGACITSLMGVAFLIIRFLGFSPDWAIYFPLAGVVLLAAGIGLFVSYFVGKKFLAKEIEAEERGLMEK